MTGPATYAAAAPDGAAFTIAWLSPLGYYTAARHNPGDPFPALMVDKASGTGDLVFSEPLVSVHALCDASTGVDADTAAFRVSKQVEARMLYLELDPTVTVTTPDGVCGGPWGLEMVEESVKVDYRDTEVIRYVSRWRLHFTRA